MPLRKIVVITLCGILCWVAAALPGFSDLTGPAQTASAPGSAETPSHRILPLPDSGSIDFSQQLRLLQQLQSLFSPTSDETNRLPALSPEHLKQMQALLKGLGGPQPNTPDSDRGAAPQLPDPPPGDTGSHLQMRRLMERLMRNRVQPRSDATPREQTGPPTPARSGAIPDRPDAADRLDHSEKPGASLAVPPGTSQPRSPGSARQLPPQKPNSAARGRAAKSGDQRPVDVKPDSPASLPDDPGSTVSGQEDPANGRGLPADNDRSTGSGSLRPRIRRSSPVPRPSSRPSGVRQSKAAVPARPDSEMTPEDVQSELQRNGFGRTIERIVDQARRKSQTAPDRRSVASAAAEKEDSPASLAEGMRSAIVRAIDDVRENVSKADEHSESPAAAGSTASKAGLTGRGGQSEVAGAAPQRNAGGQRLPPRVESGSSQRPGPGLESPDESAAGTTAGRKAGEWFSSLLRAVEPPATDVPTEPDGITKSDSPMSLDSPSSTAAAEGDAVVPLTAWKLLVVLLAVAALFRLQRYFRRHRSGTAAGFSQKARQIQAGEIRSRGDLVEAFHRFASSCTGLTREWWTHREFVRRIAAVSPATATAVGELADVYEQARYLPGHVQLTNDQMAQARAALVRCQTVTTEAGP